MAAAAIGASTILLLTATPSPPAGDSLAQSTPPVRFPTGQDSALPSSPSPAGLSYSAYSAYSAPSPFLAEPTNLDGTLRLGLAVEESCWLEIEADGKVVLSGLKETGFRIDVEARHELKLWLGNAGGVQLSLNDRPVRSLGRPGQVRKDLTITPENFRDFVSSEDRS
jgi:hypothetical protein